MYMYIYMYIMYMYVYTIWYYVFTYSTFMIMYTYIYIYILDVHEPVLSASGIARRDQPAVGGAGENALPTDGFMVR